MVQVSIIIPIYNCENYIEQCITSVQRQTLKELEVICIDDGSTDASALLVERFVKADARIRLFKQTNQGAGAARNKGMREAKGKYLAFLDADDYYSDADALEKMVALCEEKDVFVCGSLRKSLVNGAEQKNPLFQELADILNEKKVYQYKDFQFDYDFQSFIFDRRMLEKYNIVFPKYRRFEDPVFLVKEMQQVGNFVIANTYLYCMRISDAVPKFNEQVLEDSLRGLIDNLSFAKEQGLELLFEITRNRLEYEFAGIIYYNMSVTSKTILKLLLQANQVICDKSGEDDYVIRPLKRILEQVAEDKNSYKEKLIVWIENQDVIAVYGAGKYAKAFVKFLEYNELLSKIKNIIVSEQEGNPQSLMGVPVVSIDNFKDKEIPILAALGPQFHREIEDFFKEYGIINFRFLDDMFLRELT